MMIEIRKEKPEDVDIIEAVTASAFQNAPHTSHTEQFIVSALREAGALTLSLVAECNDYRIVGHLAVSPVIISDGSTNWHGLGPVSVLPEYQRQGVGMQLMQRALAELKSGGAAGCVVLGDPEYYHRFGFEVVEGFIFPGVPAEYFQALSFDGRFPEGKVTYHAAYSTWG